MTKDDNDELLKLMIQVFNDGCEQVIFPRLDDMQEEIGEKIEKTVTESERRIKKELREEFKAGQQSLSNRLEEMEVDMSEMKKKTSQMNGKMDQIVERNKDYGKRLDKVERIVKAN